MSTQQNIKIVVIGDQDVGNFKTNKKTKTKNRRPGDENFQEKHVF